jgi:hypothetical protein
MKTTITKKLLGLALSVFSITAMAQCPTVTSMSVTLGANGTATVTPVLSSPTSTMTMYYWQISPNGTLTSNMWSQSGTFQFPANGTYSLVVNVSDSLNGCWTSGGTAVTITNMTATACNANFNYYTDSSCVTHFVNTSIGNNLTYSWYINSSLYTSVNPSVGLSNGTYPAVLYTYSAGNFCDSTSQYITVSCVGGTTTPCQASFTYFTDSITCLTHFTNTTPCTYSTSSWVISGTTYYTANPVLSLTNGMHSVTLNASIVGSGINTSTNVINVSCTGGTTTPVGCQANASFNVFADSTNAGNYFAYNNATGTGTLSYAWSFGDGTSSTQQYPFHQYAVPGQYVICLTVTATSGTTTCSDTYCDSSSVQRMAAGFQMSQFNVIPQTVTGIKKLEQEVGLKAFPNPIADELTVETTVINDSKLTYVLTDALGRMVSVGSLNNSKATINTSNLEKGFYSLSITNEKGNNLKTIKLVK